MAMLMYPLLPLTWPACTLFAARPEQATKSGGATCVVSLLKSGSTYIACKSVAPLSAIGLRGVLMFCRLTGCRLVMRQACSVRQPHGLHTSQGRHPCRPPGLTGYVCACRGHFTAQLSIGKLCSSTVGSHRAHILCLSADAPAQCLLFCATRC
jgi:hypothetical protein